jgi:hypothetical protein
MERQVELGHPGAPPALLESIPMIRNLAQTAVQASTAATQLRHVQSAALESTAKAPPHRALYAAQENTAAEENQAVILANLESTFQTPGRMLPSTTR